MTIDETVTIDPDGPLPARTWVRVKDIYFDAATTAFALDTAGPTTFTR